MNLPNALIRFFLAATVILAYLILTGFLQPPLPKDPVPNEIDQEVEFDFYCLLKENGPWWDSDRETCEADN